MGAVSRSHLPESGSSRGSRARFRSIGSGARRTKTNPPLTQRRNADRTSESGTDMALLMLFALVAGAGTALSPCVLPILPAVLSAGVTGGRRRPVGVVTGLALSFTFATIGLVYVIDALGLPNGVSRGIAIVVLFGFGFCLLVPPIGDRVEAFASRLAPGPARFGGDGFGSGLGGGAPAPAGAGGAARASWSARASASSTRPVPGRSSLE